MKIDPLPPAAARPVSPASSATPPASTPRWLGIFVSTVFAAILGYFLYHYREEWHLLRGLSPAQALGLIALAVLGIAINGLKLKRILRDHTIFLASREWFGLASLSSALNSLVFKSGALLVSNHLKRRHGFPYSRFIGALGADHLIMLFINAVTGGLVALYVTFSLNKPFGPAAAAFLAIAAILFFMQCGTFRFKAGGSRLSQAVSQALDSLDGLLKNRPLLGALCAYNIVLLLTVSLRLYLACSVTDMDVSAVSCLLFTTALAFVRLLPLLQSDVGSRELTVGFLSGALGTGFKAGLVATVIDRLFEWGTAFALAFFFRNCLHAPPPVENGTPPIPRVHP